MGLNNGQFNDTLAGHYLSLRTSVSSSSAIEAKVGATRLDYRQLLTIYNDGNNTIYVGPATVTNSGANRGFPLERNESLTVSASDTAVFIISASGGSFAIIQEWS